MPSFRRATYAAVALMLVGTSPLLGQGPAGTPARGARAALLDRMIDWIVAEHVDSFSRDELYEAAAKAVVSHLNDPYAKLFVGKEYDLFNARWHYAGIGAVVQVFDSVFMIMEVFPGSPAAAADIHPGDVITGIDGLSTRGMATAEDIVKVLRGTDGSSTTVTLRRFGVAQPKQVTLARAQITTTPVRPAVVLDDSIGYLALEAVSDVSAQAVKAELDQLKQRGVRALILDQRRNGGGSIDNAAEIAGYFLDEGQTIGTLSQRNGTVERLTSQGPHVLQGMPIVVLTGPRTASTAEWITSALQENDRALVVGTPTFGKGVGQRDNRLADSTLFVATMLRWRTATGRDINRVTRDSAWGTPRITAMASSDSALLQRPLHRTAGGRIIRGGAGVVPDVIIRPDSGEWLYANVTKNNPQPILAAVASLAFETKASGRATSDNLVITSAMRKEVYRRLKAQGVVFREKSKALDAMIDRRLGVALAQYTMTWPAELRFDPEIKVARELLRRAQTDQDLLKQASSEQGYVVHRP